MSRQRRAVVSCLAAVLLAAPSARADASVPMFVPVQGRLLDGADQPVNAQVTLTYAIYDLPETPTGSTPTPPLWAGTYQVSVTNGVYALQLGDTTTGQKALPAELFDGSGARWLGVAVNAGTEFKPRLRVASVPHAFLAQRALKADDAKTLMGEAPASLHDASKLTGLAPAAVLGNGAATIATVGTVTTGTWNATPVEDSYVKGAAGWNAKLDAVAHDGSLSGDGKATPLSVAYGTTTGTAAAGDDARFTSLDAKFAGYLPTSGGTVSGNLSVGGITQFAQGAFFQQGVAITGNASASGNGGFGGNVTVGGNLGVGTTSPAEKLAVVGPAAKAVIGSTAHTALYAGYDGQGVTALDVNASGEYAGLNLINDGPTTTGIVSFYNKASTATDKRLATFLAQPDDNAASGRLMFFTNNAGSLAERMRIDKAGNVGIGTSAPRAEAKLDVAGRIYSKDAAAFMVYSGNFAAARQLVVKWTGTSCSSQRQYKFWVDDTATTDTIWSVYLRDGSAVSTDWYSVTPSLFGVGTSEATALQTGICADSGALYLNTASKALTLSACDSCTPLLYFAYNNVVPVVTGNFIKPIGTTLQR